MVSSLRENIMASKSLEKPFFTKSPKSLRKGAFIFYLGPNHEVASTLAKRMAELPIAVCYYWSPELLNLTSLWPFNLGLVMAKEWEALLFSANNKIREKLSKTPVYILQMEEHLWPLKDSPFPVWILGHLIVDAGLIYVTAKVWESLLELEEQEILTQQHFL